MKIAEYGAKKIVITGIDSGIFLTNYIYDTGKGIYTTRQRGSVMSVPAPVMCFQQ